MMRWSSCRVSLALAGVSALFVSCSSSPSAPGPQPTATPTPIATPTPTPTPEPTPDPQAGLAPGPVTRVTLYIYQQYHGGKPEQGGQVEQKKQDAQGRWILHIDDFLVFDSTQKNTNNEICRYDKPPAYRLLDLNGVLSVRGSSNPFLYRADVVGKGEFELVSSVDGIDSTPLRGIVE